MIFPPSVSRRDFPAERVQLQTRPWEPILRHLATEILGLAPGVEHNPLLVRLSRAGLTHPRESQLSHCMIIRSCATNPWSPSHGKVALQTLVQFQV